MFCTTMYRSMGAAALLAVAHLLVLSEPVAADQLYTITLIDTIEPSDTSLWASDLNDNGQVVGHVNRPDGQKAFIWDQTNGTVLLGALGGAYPTPRPYSDYISQTAHSINNAGQVVGRAMPGIATGGDPKAWIWNSANGMVDLDSATNPDVNAAKVINNSGRIAVDYLKYSSSFDATAHYLDGDTRTNLHPFDGVTWHSSTVNDMNENGDVVGRLEQPHLGPYAPHAGFYYDATADTWTELPSSFATDGRDADAEVYALNSNSTLVGYGLNDSDNDVPFYWNPGDDTMTAVPLLDGATEARAYDINDSGLIVGSGENNAWLYDPSTDTVYNLEDQLVDATGWDLQGARGINESGQIIGYGTLNGSSTRGFLLTPVAPVPEPTTGTLLIAALVGLCCLRPRRKR